MCLYKVCYTIGSRRHQVLCADYATALRTACKVWGLCLYSFEGRYHHPRLYQMTDEGWKENEEYYEEII